MKLIKPSYEIIEQTSGIEGVYKQIELAGRICYKSEDKITENSAKDFVDRMIASKHLAMCEHGTLYFKIPTNTSDISNFLDEVPIWTKCRLVESKDDDWWAISTNLRVMVEHFAPEYIEDLIEKYLCEPTEYHEKRITVKFIADIGVIREFFRHRVFSMAQESTRYCNYNKNKFNNELTFIIPAWCDIPNNPTEHDLKTIWGKHGSFEERFLMNCLIVEAHYKELIEHGYQPQQARCVLPLSLKSEAVMTGFVSDWKHFFDLRSIGITGAPHPQAKELAEPLMNEFKKLNYI